MPEHFSLERHIKDLEEIEAYFQDPNMNIDEAIRKHQEALGVAKKVLDYLATAETAIQEIDVTTALNSTDEAALAQ